MDEHIAPVPVVTYTAQAPGDEYNATSAPAVEYDAPAPAVTDAAPARVILHVAPPQVVHDVASAPALGDTGFDTSWNRLIRHCEVIRIGGRDCEGQIRVRYAGEDPRDWRSGTWIPCRFFRPDLRS